MLPDWTWDWQERKRGRKENKSFKEEKWTKRNWKRECEKEANTYGKVRDKETVTNKELDGKKKKRKVIAKSFRDEIKKRKGNWKIEENWD